MQSEELFMPGDVIYAVNGKEVSGLESLRKTVADLKPGQPVAVQVERRGQTVFVAFEAE
jgi:S1-C subfamily serine protease